MISIGFVVILVALKVDISSCESLEEDPILFKNFLNPLTLKDENPNDNGTAYDKVMQSLRRNWQLPANYLKHRGYLSKRDSKIKVPNNELSMDTFNLLNGLLLNPSTNLNEFPTYKNAIQSIKSDISGSDEESLNQELGHGGLNSETGTKGFNDNSNALSAVSKDEDVIDFESYLGENFIQNVKDKWISWIKRNSTESTSQNATSTTTAATTTTTTTTTTTATATSTTTTESPQSHPTVSKDVPVLGGLSIEEARKGLEFFKLYNSFILATLASKLSANHINQPCNELKRTLTASANFSHINENDIKILQELKSCLQSENKDSAVQIPKQSDVQADKESDGIAIESNNTSNDGAAQVSQTYLSTKLKFLAHRHHEVFDIGRYSSDRKFNKLKWK